MASFFLSRFVSVGGVCSGCVPRVCCDVEGLAVVFCFVIVRVARVSYLVFGL